MPPEPVRPGIGGDAGPAIGLRNPAPPPIDELAPHGYRIVDGDVLPIVKVTPQYPAAAIRRGIEGYVIVAFTVTRTGAVADVRVEESSNAVFEKAAVEAAYKLRYRPRVVDGEPVDLAGVRHRFTFELDR